MKTRNLLMACACALFTLAGQAQTQVIAHRGFWKAEGSAQNSIAGLKKLPKLKYMVLNLTYSSQPTEWW